jgi:hypothetical protein
VDSGGTNNNTMFNKTPNSVEKRENNFQVEADNIFEDEEHPTVKEYGGKNYAKILAKNRPITPPNMPLIYSAYL